MRARVGRDLPVGGKGLALGEVGDENCCEGYRERDAGDAEEEGVAVLAGQADEAVEEFEGDDFEEPEAALGWLGVVGRGRGRGLTWLGGEFD